MSETTPPPAAPAPAGNGDRADAVYRFTAQQVLKLQRDRDQSGSGGSRAVALLARLRRVATAEPGTDPGVWDATLDGAPGSPSDGRISEPTREERAIHLALAMYATAQQGVADAAHAQGAGLGTAVQQLERLRPGAGDSGRSPVRRRFDALATATDLPELAVHLRGLVTQMRGTTARLDYARLASDLFWYQVPGRAGSVRRTWARDFYALRGQDDRSASAAPTNDTTSKEN
ncbi:type I-E CRISPR-associated protein Cse2/CasB [Myceligenerans crystallogenes]|uniref:CRISPR system Cascade subunit CasB n=1 Tax=Myceligenerans crystallogenes TaxID=316335 RepID=A0ABP4ZT45_9MICO